MLSSNDLLNQWLTNNLVPSDDEEFFRTTSRLRQSLDSHYDDKIIPNNMIIAGSFGRMTHTKNTSDHDLLYILDASIKDRLDDNSGNIQSQLLTEVKDVIKQTFSRTDLHSDGQVVSVQLHKGTIELVPVFSRSDGKFDFPNTHHGGSWEITNPIPEIKQSQQLRTKYPKFQMLARLIRSWRSYSGIKLKGIVIDSILSNYYENNWQAQLDIVGNLETTLFDVLEYMGKISKDEFAMIGRNDEMYNNGDLTFVLESKRLSDEYSTTYNDAQRISLFVEMFGKHFPGYDVAKNETFIEDQFTDIKLQYSLNLSATIDTNGMRPISLKNYFHKKMRLPGRKNLLSFKVENASELPKGAKFHWKVRNIGHEAKLNGERGAIQKSTSANLPTWSERTNFTGDHFVEVYAVQNNILIGRGRINVPIES